MRSKTITIATVILLTLGMTATTAAQAEDASDGSDVEVSVSEETAVDIDPTQLEFSNVQPGEQVETSDGEYAVEAVTVENIGSNPIERVWMDASTPDGTTPFATGDRDNYDTGNFIQVAINADAETRFSDSMSNYGAGDEVFVNRVDYAEHNDLSYVFTETDGNQYGRFRAEGTAQDGVEEDGADIGGTEDEEYFWEVDTTFETDSWDAPNRLRVGVDPQTQEETGSTDFTDNSEEYEEYNLEDTEEQFELGDTSYDAYEVTDGPVGETGREYGVIVGIPNDVDNEDDADVVTVRSVFNSDFQGIEIPDTDDIFNSGTGEDLEPGDNFAVDVGVAVPRGVPSGDNTDSDGLLTVNVVAAE